MELTPRLAIQETLREMDSFQTQKVLEFIRSLSVTPTPRSRRSDDYFHFKEQALREIRLALEK
ncbi:MAG TPA: hypothetical protein VFW11_10815 [Cyclobacteriaceae bacterium]|nr:hypothetical protein [Cyclobacteriaceae bacterium]